MASDTEDPRIGLLLNNRYILTERIASGGMGVVYKGERLELGRPVAIKFLHESFKEDPKILNRFEREARAMSKLSHPYCVSVIDFGVESAPYIVMDFVTGATLRDLMADERLTVERAIRITNQLLSALSHAHGQGIIHRDIKPENIVLCEAEGLGEHVRVLDFGLAKLLGKSMDANQSANAMIMGTPSYMSPEQTKLEECDSRSDLYSTGVILFEMLTGKKPFTDDDTVAVLKMHRDKSPPRLSEADPFSRFSDEMEDVIKRALTKSPIDRFQSAEEFAAALNATPEAQNRDYVNARSLDTTEPFSYDEPSKGEASKANSTANADSKRERFTLFRYGAAALLIIAVVAVLVFASTSKKSKPSLDPSSSSPPAEKPAAVEPTEVEPVLAAPGEAGPSERADGSVIDADGSVPDAGDLTMDFDPQSAPQDVLVFTLDEATAKLPPPTVEEIRALIKANRLDEAIQGLKVLRHRNPSNPKYIFLLANVYFEKRWWSDAMDLYKVVIKLSPKYKKNAKINNNLITAFGSDKTYRKARKIIIKDIRKPALPFLKRAAKRHKYQIVRERAKSTAKKISRGWFGRLFV